MVTHRLERIDAHRTRVCRRVHRRGVAVVRDDGVPRGERALDDDLPHPPQSDDPELHATAAAAADMVIPVAAPP